MISRPSSSRLPSGCTSLSPSTALNAGKHVFTEKAMANSIDGCRRMIEAARSAGRHLQVGHQRNANPLYQEAYQLIREGVIGDVYHVRSLWHRNKSWRRAVPETDFDPSPWGYPDMEHLRNWRLYRKYSYGLNAELGTHHLQVVNWFTGKLPKAVYGSGGIYAYDDGPRGGGPHLRHLRVSGRPDLHLLLHSDQRLRPLLRAVHGHRRHHHPHPGAGSHALLGGRTGGGDRAQDPGHGRRPSAGGFGKPGPGCRRVPGHGWRQERGLGPQGLFQGNWKDSAGPSVTGRRISATGGGHERVRAHDQGRRVPRYRAEGGHPRNLYWT